MMPARVRNRIQLFDVLSDIFVRLAATLLRFSTCTRYSPLSRCVHCRLEPSMRGRGKALVYVDVAAAAHVTGSLPSLQMRPDSERYCP